MLSAVNFNGKVATGYIQGEKNAKGERVIIMDKPEDGIITKTVKSAAYARKGYVAAKEGLFGFASAAGTGLAAGASVMSLGWLFNKVAKGQVDKDLFITPLKTVGGLIAATAKKAVGVFNKSFIDVVKYPFIGFPRDVFKYVKNANCPAFVKTMGVTIGLAAAGVVALGTMIKINKAMAEVDHGFKVGHNK